MELDHEELLEPLSPTAGYMKSSALEVVIFGVLELEKPIDEDEDNSKAMQLLKDYVVPINHRFSSVVIRENGGEKKWKQVKYLNVEDHVKVPIFPKGKSVEYYDECFKNYMEKIVMEHLPEDRPLWEVHIIKYPTSNAAGTVVFKLHHALGDGYSFMGVLLSCLQRSDDPSLPLTFPSRESKTISSSKSENNSFLSSIPGFFSKVFNTFHDLGLNVLKSTVVQDDYSPIRREGSMEFRQITMADFTISLDRIKKITTRLKVTINDAISGVIFYGTRLYMEEMDSKSRLCNSTGLVVLNTRGTGGYKSVSEMNKPNAEMPWGNRFTLLPVKLPKLNASLSSNPLDFILEARRTIQRKRKSPAVDLTHKLFQILGKVRGPEEEARFFFNSVRNSSLLMSNLIGPMEKMALANHPVKGLYFFVSGAPLNIVCTMASYVGNMRICLTVDKDFIDVYKFKSCLEIAFEEIFQAAVHPNSAPAK